MENDILAQLADLIDSKMKEFMIADEEVKEFQHTCDEFDRNSKRLLIMANDFKEEVDRDEVSVTDAIKFKDEFIQGIEELKDNVNYMIALFNSLVSKNVLDLSEFNVNEAFNAFYKTLNGLDALEKSLDITYE